MPMRRPEEECLENEHVERALEKLELVGARHGASVVVVGRLPSVVDSLPTSRRGARFQRPIVPSRKREQRADERENGPTCDGGPFSRVSTAAGGGLRKNDGL